MNYHDIKIDDMNNGDGLRVTLFVSGCSHQCEGCHNSETWSYKSGISFDRKAKEEIYNQLSKDYISGITFSGGDPFHRNNIGEVTKVINDIKSDFPTKTIWVYTGFLYEYIYEECHHALENVDVLVDGRFIQDLADIKYHWAGSTNQRVIDVQESLRLNKVVLYSSSGKE
jgi:anaerobic ribonucleoside-triphosphate reductase activating protein